LPDNFISIRRQFFYLCSLRRDTVTPTATRYFVIAALHSGKRAAILHAHRYVEIFSVKTISLIYLPAETVLFRQLLVDCPTVGDYSVAVDHEASIPMTLDIEQKKQFYSLQILKFSRLNVLHMDSHLRESYNYCKDLVVS